VIQSPIVIRIESISRNFVMSDSSTLELWNCRLKFTSIWCFGQWL